MPEAVLSTLEILFLINPHSSSKGWERGHEDPQFTDEELAEVETK